MKRKQIIPEQKEEGKKLTIADSLAFLLDVKETFKDRSERYDEFRQVVLDYGAKRIDFTSLAARVKELLKGHQELISGFNAFLPKGYNLPIEDEQLLHQTKIPEDFEGAGVLVKKIKTRYGGEEDQKCKSESSNSHVEPGSSNNPAV